MLLVDKTQLISILHDWNFWNNSPKTGVARPFYLNRLKTALTTQQVIVITGPRRSGKSVIMRQMIQGLMAEGVAAKNCMMINFEDPRLGALDVSTLQNIYDTYLEYLNPSNTPYVFLDEIQEVDGWEKWVCTLHELGKARLIISGSNAKLLSRELSTLLTGRHVDVTILPLSFHEYLSFKGIKPDQSLPSADMNIILSRMLREYLDFGGFPEVALADEKKQILLGYYDDIVTKDLIQRFKIRKSEQMKNLSRYFLSNVSSAMTFNACAKFLDLSVDTVEKFSGYLQDAYLFFLTKRYSHKFKEQEKSPRKLYCIDNGLSNVIGFNTSPNRGRLLEQTVFQELSRRQLNNANAKIFYWKNADQKEVDFVIRDGLKVTGLIQVCADVSDPKTKKRELRSLLKAMDEFKLAKGLIITMDHDSTEVEAGKSITYIPLKKWLLA